MPTAITPGRIIIAVGNLLYSIGAFIADWSVTHVLNPRWPPHAKFHNGQTMSLGALLCSTSLYFAFRSSKTPKEDLFHASLIGSFYCAAGLCAILYPGTDWQDPEFDGAGEQRYLFFGVVVAMWVGYALDTVILGKFKTA
jgi:hypothetical protein